MADNGDIASFPDAYWWKKLLVDASKNTVGKWRITAMPGGPRNVGGSFIGIPAEGEHKKQAFEVAKWLVSPENQAYQLKHTALFPSSQKAFEADENLFVKEEFFGGKKTALVFVEAAKDIPILYYGPKSGALQSIFQEQLKTVAEQGKDSEEAWNDAIKKSEEEMNR